MKITDVTIIVPTRGRKELVEKLLSQVTHRPLLLVVEQGRELIDVPADIRGATMVIRPPDLGCPKAYEYALSEVKTTHVLGLTDDIDIGEFMRDRWLPEAVKVWNDQIGERDGVLALESTTAYQREFLMMTKAFYMEHLFPVPYLCGMSDFEAWEKAKRLGVAADSPNSVVRHVHFGERNRNISQSENEICHHRMNDWAAKNREKITKRVFVALPIYWNVDPLFFQCFLKFMKEHQCEIVVDIAIGDSAVGRCRNDLTRRFLESECTHMMFIDTDLVFSAAQVSRLLSHDVDLIGGFYPKKQEGPLNWVCNAIENPEYTESGLVTVKYMGTGFMLIKRRVFELMIQHYGPQISYVRDGDPTKTVEHDFWHMGTYQYKDGSRRYLSEDWWFCQKWLDLGGKVWADRHVILKHSGSALYPLKAQEAGMVEKEAQTEPMCEPMICTA